MFKEGVEEPAEVASFAKKVTEADAVLISTPEQQHSVPSSLKSALEWLSSAEHPFKDKPVVIVGTSVFATRFCSWTKSFKDGTFFSRF